jgi:radical SAM superfamily enzyme YgiQ (UPF0313 family)
MLNRKSPEQIRQFMDRTLYKFDNPAVFLGNEPNTFHWTDEEWNKADLKVLLVCPFDNLQAMGNNTIPLLYSLSNEYDHVNRVTERWYFPSSRRELDLMERSGIPPWGLESQHAIADFDLLACSASYPPLLMNLIKTFRMGGIPVKAEDRVDLKEDYPLIMLGGHTHANPWMFSPVLDVVWLGEAEDESKEAQESARMSRDEKANPATYWVKPNDNPGFNHFCDRLAESKREGSFYDAQGREDFLHRLSIEKRHIIVPRFYNLTYAKNKDGHHIVTGWDKKYDDLPDKVQKRIVRNLDEVKILTEPPVPHVNTDIVAAVQAARGCTYRCSFCAASYREVPYRERSQQVMLDSMAAILRNTGASTVQPTMLEFGTYSRKKALMKEVMETITDEFGMPSVRVDVFGGDPVFGQLAVEAHQRGVTIAVEGNSQRMREVISKGIQEEDILRAFSNAVAAGYRTAKLYMICDLPGEDASDHEEIVDLCRKLDAIRRSSGSKIQVRLSWQTLTVQPWTPLQWQQARVRSVSFSPAIQEIKKLGFGVQFGREVHTALGTYCQLAELADPIAAECLVDAVIETDAVTFGALSKRTYFAILENLEKHGRTLDDYYRAKDVDEIFAWDIVDPLISKSYLLRHHEMVQKRLAGDPEIYGQGFLEKFGSCSIGCAQCGACDDELLTTMEAMATRVDEAVKLSEINTIDRRSVRQKYILKVDFSSDKRYCSFSFWTHLIRRACYVNDLPVAIKSVRFSTQKIKAIRPWFSGRVYVEIGFTEALDCDLVSILNTQMEQYGATVVDATEISINQSFDDFRVDTILWEVEVDVPALQLEAVFDKAVSDPSTVITIRTDEYRAGKQTVKLPIKDCLKMHEIHSEGRNTILSMLLTPTINPYDIIDAIVPRSDPYRTAAKSIAALNSTDSQGDAFTPDCMVCGRPIQYELDKLFDADVCVFHRNQKELAVIAD